MVYRLEGLPLPAESGADTNESVALFLRHALRANPGQTRDAHSLADIARICRLVGGTPLAIVLAASSASALTLTEIGDEVTRSLDVLETEMRDMPARHRSMRGVLDATWTRLAPVEQQAFAVLSLFRGGFTRAAALAVTGMSIRTLLALHSKSLVRHEDRRYSIHELLRQFGVTKLTESGGRNDAEIAYAEHFLGWLASREPALLDMELGTVSEIDPDFENLRQAWLIAVERKRFDLIDACLRGLMQYCKLRGRMPDAHALLTTATAGSGPSHFRARLIAQRAYANEVVGGFAQEVEDARSALDSPGANWPAPETVWLMNRQGYALRRMGEFSTALAIFQSALAICRGSNDAHSEAETLSHQGMIYWTLGDFDGARRLMEEALGIVRRNGYSDRVAAQAALCLAQTYVPTGETAKAIPLLESALSFSRRAHDAYFELESLMDLGVIYGQAGMQAWEAAMRYTEETIALANKIGAPHESAWSFWNLGCAHTALGDYRRALLCTDQSIHLAAFRGDPFIEAFATMGRSDTYFGLGLFKLALADLEAANRSFEAMKTTMATGLILRRFSSIRGKMGARDASSGVILEDALKLAMAASNFHHVRELRNALCEFYFDQGDFNTALRSAQDLIAFASAEKHHGGRSHGLLWLGRARVALGQLAEGMAALHDALVFAEANRYHRMRLDTHRALQRAYATQADPRNSDLHRRAADALVAEIAENLKNFPHLLAGLHTL